MRKPARTTLKSRKSTLTNAMVHSIVYRQALTGGEYSDWLKRFNQVVNEEKCIYCGNIATSFDHIFNLVKHGKPTGYMTEMNNLVPCCGTCNSKKAGSHWEDFVNSEYFESIQGWKDRKENIITLLDKYKPIKIDFETELNNVYKKFELIKKRLFNVIDESEEELNQIRIEIANNLKEKK